MARHSTHHITLCVVIVILMSCCEEKLLFCLWYIIRSSVSLSRSFYVSTWMNVAKEWSHVGTKCMQMLNCTTKKLQILSDFSYVVPLRVAVRAQKRKMTFGNGNCCACCVAQFSCRKCIKERKKRRDEKVIEYLCCYCGFALAAWMSGSAVQIEFQCLLDIDSSFFIGVRHQHTLPLFIPSSSFLHLCHYAIVLARLLSGGSALKGAF